VSRGLREDHPGTHPEFRISIPRIPVSETDLQSRVIPVSEPTLGEIRHMVERMGFIPLKLSYANTILLPVVAVRSLTRRLLGIRGWEMRPFLRWLNRSLTGVLRLEAMWLRWHTFPIGSSVVCLAQKPVK
jgi:hypothetical protein